MTKQDIPHEVLFTHVTEQDMKPLYDDIAESNCVANANRLLGQLEKAVGKLVQFPDRGNHPKELAALGIKEYRQTHSSPIASFTQS